MARFDPNDPALAGGWSGGGNLFGRPREYVDFTGGGEVDLSRTLATNASFAGRVSGAGIASDDLPWLAAVLWSYDPAVGWNYDPVDYVWLDTAGRYRFDDLPPGIYAISVQSYFGDLVVDPRTTLLRSGVKTVNLTAEFNPFAASIPHDAPAALTVGEVSVAATAAGVRESFLPPAGRVFAGR